LQESTLGVKLLLPVDEYQKNLRAVKYAIMFIAMTFFAFTIIDALCASPFHPIQYTLVGLALILFFVLLLSMSEYLSFNISYLLASISINLVICMYTRGVTRGWEITITIASILTVLYAFLFVLLQVEDYALMLGSMGLLVSLTLVMYLTRGIDWFGTGVPKDRESEPICRTEPCPE
jgi:inner membrane protein